MSQKNTLFKYFNKSPGLTAKAKSAGSPTEADPPPPGASSPPTEKERGPRAANAKRERGSDVAQAREAAKAPKSSEESEFQPGDLLWAKLEGYPWWPSLVYDHPESGAHTRGRGKSLRIHVQFFDTPPTRSWVGAKYCKPYNGSSSKEAQRGGVFFSTNPQILGAMKQADKAIPLSMEKRLDLVVCVEPSDEEDSDEADEEMEVDAIASDVEANGKGDGEEEEKEEDDGGSDGTACETRTPLRSTRKTALEKNGRKNKRRRIVVPSDTDDSDAEFKPDTVDASSDEASSGVDEKEASEPESASDPESPVKKRKRTTTKAPALTPSRQPLMLGLSSVASSGKAATPKQAQTGSNAKAKLSAFSSDTLESQNGGGQDGGKEGGGWDHEKLDWLRDGKRRDGKRRLQSDPEYDPSSIYVPDSFLSACTPGMRRWWEIKSTLFDTVLFFKVGKFYELYHMDALTGVSELGLLFMKGTWAHSGFPETSFARFSDGLVQKGYKVARVEQTETPDMMEARCRAMARPATKLDKVVKREVCRIITKGTQTYSILDGDPSDAQNKFLLAVREREGPPGGSGNNSGANETGASVRTYGVCFVDTSVGVFHLGQFTDDRHCSRFRTLVAHHAPAQVLYERGGLSAETQKIVRVTLASALQDALTPSTQFWDATKTLKVLAEEGYFKVEDERGGSGGGGGSSGALPPVLRAMTAASDSLGLAAADEAELALSALGAMLFYLRKCLIDHELLSMGNFRRYQPPDLALAGDAHNGHRDANEDDDEEEEVGSTGLATRRMVLDGVTLTNLEVLQSSTTGGVEGTLLVRLDSCLTPFGRRLLRAWLVAPPCDPRAIDDRLDALEDLMAVPDKVLQVKDLLRKMPDLERLLSKIHGLGTPLRASRDHPDSRAILYEETAYSKRKIADFLSTLEGFRAASQAAGLLQECAGDFKSRLLRKVVSTEDGGHFPDLSPELQRWDTAFDHQKARSSGVITPRPGFDPEYDQALLDISANKKLLDEYLEKQRKRLSCKSIVYWGTGRNCFQMEVPDAVAQRNTPEEYQLKSTKKGFRRFHSPEIERLMALLSDAEERRDIAMRDCMRRLFYNFDASYKQWSAAMHCMAVLDVLLSLAHYSEQGGEGANPMCRPSVRPPPSEGGSSGGGPFLELRGSRHPCVSTTFLGDSFIPNDVVVGLSDGDDDGGARCVLVTGPNMGGKSTLMRQAGLIVIMAQLGCYVPAEACRLTPVDRVFTRLGASDRIMSGESTFFVELSETSSILQHATRHSLVLLDELGRGTATYDGTAIASAVVHELAEGVRCRTLFSTHYHSLVEDFAASPHVRLGHMACMVEQENDDDPSQETITFLYKFVAGACPKSYGFNAARLAGLPDAVVRAGHRKAREFESSTNALRAFRMLCSMSEGNFHLEKLKDIQRMIGEL
uniref:DNA mismatch repair protein n=1 Tax=Petromyzon marinus TaxID=7757 RepID=A0AAJ7T7W9_PETMA|nr:DNA mismatch repair protein Msh6 [Petromyzon marinus]